MTDAAAVEDQRITRDPSIMVGKPIVRGTRIPAELILEQLAFNLDLDDLFGAYPELTTEDVKACLRYAHKLIQRERSDLLTSTEATRASA
jgi:uncharacterized protein (DUF433 family)